ncbi:MAG: SUMF1/EgtB/PvdO family nonheme iron enzyme [Polyangiaceae bacterium]|nr:SUMF1/EgtB/PvdO family nonheme iron enzyme [Polyangiaceae bacterium]
MAPRRHWALSLGLLYGATACQIVLGFEDFEGAGAAGGHAGVGTWGHAGAEMGGREAAGGDAVAVGQGGAGGASGAPATGGRDGAEGDACAATEDCLGDLVCLYGRCRIECSDETGCPSSSLCLYGGTVGGCRLPSESSCERDLCENAQLVCGLDNSCRVACSSAHSCDAPTQRCVAGTCVSTVGQDAERFDCGRAGEGQVVCDGADLGVCNVLGPGIVTVADCETAGICEASIPEGGEYDPEDPPECVEACAAGQAYCEGATLLECKEDGSGPVDAGRECATVELCEDAVADDARLCAEPACAEAETRCSGGQTSLTGDICNQGRTAFEARDLCDVAGLQCNPATGGCVSFHVDPTEVTRADYLDWVQQLDAPPEQPVGCEWNAIFEPGADCLAGAACAADDCPVVCVDWCDALAYCAAQGKHLCGRLGGGMVRFEDYADPGQSEWTNACSAAGQFLFGHGNAVPETEADECVYAGNSGGTAFPVGSRRACHSPGRGYSNLYDLSGNVAEWEDSCERAVSDGQASEVDACRTRGGSFASDSRSLECARVPTVPLERGAVSPDVGIRCCQD